MTITPSSLWLGRGPASHATLANADCSAIAVIQPAGRCGRLRRKLPFRGRRISPTCIVEYNMTTVVPAVAWGYVIRVRLSCSSISPCSTTRTAARPRWDICPRSVPARLDRTIGSTRYVSIRMTSWKADNVGHLTSPSSNEKIVTEGIFCLVLLPFQSKKL